MLERALEDILATKVAARCGFARWIASLDDDDQARLDELLRHDDVTGEDIVAVLAPHFTISVTSVRRHRRSLISGGKSGCGCV